MAEGRARVVAWDPQQDWRQHGLVSVGSLSALASQIASANIEPPAPLRVTYPGPLDRVAFGVWCELAYCAGKVDPCLVIVEELAWVTDPGKAPRGWHELVTGGLKYGIDIVSITQRPSESDKTALSQADVVYCFQMERPGDRKYMAAELDVDVAAIAALKPLDFLVKDRRAGTIETGRLAF